jgi:hypothetical protein
VPEIYGSGCQASATSLILIKKSLAAAKRWCGAREDADWTGPLYQSANRLAHLYFIRERLKRSAWLINLYFTGDPYRPTNQDEWHRKLQIVKNTLGLTTEVPGVIDLFLPALSANLPSQSIPVNEAEALSACGGQDKSCQEGVSTSHPSDVPDEDTGTTASDVAQLTVGDTSADLELGSFARWRDRWTVLAEYQSNSIPGIQHRIDQLVSLWKEPIPGAWQRGIDPQLLYVRYRRATCTSRTPANIRLSMRYCVATLNECRASATHLSMESMRSHSLATQGEWGGAGMSKQICYCLANSTGLTAYFYAR